LGKLDFNQLLIQSIPVMLPKMLSSHPLGQQVLAQTGMSPEQLSQLFADGAREAAAAPPEYQVPSGGARQLMRHWQAVRNEDIREALEHVWDNPDLDKQAEEIGNLLWHIMGWLAVNKQNASVSPKQADVVEVKSK